MKKKYKLNPWEIHPLLINPKLAVSSGAFEYPKVINKPVESYEAIKKKGIFSLNVMAG